jgi:hypothetical protein
LLRNRSGSLRCRRLAAPHDDGVGTEAVSGGSDSEHSEYVITEASGNKFGGANTSQSMHFDVWYTMPSQQKEALISLSFSMYDNNGRSFTKTATINITP